MGLQSRAVAASRVVVGVICAVLAPARGVPAPTVTTDKDHIFVDGAPLFLKGIDYSPFIAGDAPWTEITKVTFADDLLEIRDKLHANAVRIYDPLPKEFYDAARDTGLWVIQGISLPGRPDLVAALPELKGIVEDAVDAIYARGGADVILAYALGNSFPATSVAETIWRHQDHPRFQGIRYKLPAESHLPRVDRYVEVHECEPCRDPDLPRTPEKYPDEKFPDPHPFQSVIAELAEHLAGLEELPGRSRHLIGHAITPVHNAFLGARDRSVPEIDLPVHLGFLDVIFENAFTYSHAYIAYYGFPAYLERLKIAYPDRPVVVLETGYSASPTGLPPAGPLCGFIRKDPLPLTGTFGGMADLQAQALEARWVDVVTAARPLAGFFVYEFYDEWWIGREPGRRNPNEPLEFFGLKSVSGSPRAPLIEPRAAYFKIAAAYGCEEISASPSDCGLVIRSPRLLEATHGVAFEASLEAAGGSSPYVWSIDDPGALPLGLALDAGSGRIEGIPERTGTFRFEITVTDRSVPPLSRTRLSVLRVAPPVFSTDPEARQILRNGEPFFLKGIDYSSFIAGDAPWTSMVIADPHRDMKEIKETLHANAIRVYQVVPQTVYDAARENGLFVIQGIHLPMDCLPEPHCPIPGDPLCKSDDPAKLEPLDLLAPARLQKLKDHVRREIDEIHSFGASDTILCYVVGNEINFCTARATILRNQAQPRYKGTFYSVPDETRLPGAEGFGGCPSPVDRFWDPHPLQSVFAELADHAAVGELERYGVRRLMGHSTDPNMSLVPDAGLRFEPREHFPVDFGFLDIVFQNVYSYFPPYIRYFGYRRYLEECASERGYPRTPFVVLECGYSTSPVAEQPDFCATDGFYAEPPCPALPRTPHPDSLCFGVNSDDAQARGLAVHFENASRPGPSGVALAAGFFVFEYYDEWWKGSGATQGLFVQDPNRAEEWFGLKKVSGVRGECGDRSGLRIENSLAFDTVSRMFDREWWCPREVEHRVVPGGVEISIPGGTSYDRLVVLRDGVKIADIKPAPATFTDPEPPAGPHTYAVVLEKSFIACPTVEFAEVVPSGVFRRGDADLNGRLELTDAVVILEHLFRGGAAPGCLDSADADDGGDVNITDPIGILNHLFQGGPPPGPPGPDVCGPDATMEEPDLGCEASCP